MCTPDVPMEHYCSAEAIAEGIQAEAEWVAEQAARSTTTTPPTTDNDNSGDGPDISGDDGIRDGGPGHDRDRDQDNDPQAPTTDDKYSMKIICSLFTYLLYHNKEGKHQHRGTCRHST